MDMSFSMTTFVVRNSWSQDPEDNTLAPLDEELAPLDTDMALED
jgi:hypothetical protein